MHPKEVAYRGLEHNRKRVMEGFKLSWIDHTPPAEHYPHRYKWDSGFFIEIYTAAAKQFRKERSQIIAGKDEFAELPESKRLARTNGLKTFTKDAVRRAVSEAFSIFEGQKPNGMIPNVHFAPAGRSRDPERTLAFGKDATGSNYDQPSVTAVPILELYEFIAELDEKDPELARDNPEVFLEQIYHPLKKSLDFWDKYRTDERDSLIAVIHPHETGRDSDPTFDSLIKPLRLKRKGVETGRAVNTINALADYAGSLHHSRKIGKTNGDIEKQKEIFWVKDVMVNCIHVDNLLAMTRLAEYAKRPDDAIYYKHLAQTIEQQIINKMFNEEDGVFYNINSDNTFLKEVSINNLFTLLLPNLPADKLEAVIDLMDKSFDAPFPLPSVGTTSPNYDPHNEEPQRLWRGPTWINTNAYLTDRGLLMQSEREDLSPELRAKCFAWAERITMQSFKLLEQNGAREHYNSEIGGGQRFNVKGFGWSYRALTMKLLEHLELDKHDLEGIIPLSNTAKESTK